MLVPKEAVTAACAVGAVLGAAAGLALGWRYLDAGFAPLLLLSVRRWVHWGLLGVPLFLLLLRGVARTAERCSPRAVARLIAYPLAAAPFLALAAYRLNRTWGIRPSSLLEPWALRPNLLLAGAGLSLCLVLGLALEARSVTFLFSRWRRWALGVGVLVLALDGAAAVLLPRGDKPGPDVLILLVDALRADHLGAYGHHRPTTPAIDALARDGVVFSAAVSQSTFTKTSIASLFTGRYPYQHGVYWGSHVAESGTVTADVLSEREVTVAEVLQRHGYLTAAWVQNSTLGRDSGIAQGFVEYRANQGSITRINRLFARWLRGPGRRFPFFAYLHYIDLHDPYRPRPPYDRLFGDCADVYAGIDLGTWGAYLEAVRTGRQHPSLRKVEQMEACYDGQLRFIDAEIGRLLEEIREAGLYEESLIVLTADHGDGFLEHGFLGHSTTPYEELIRVPLIVKLPHGRYAGRVVDSQVRLIDLMPSILAAAGVREALEVPGCSLLPLLEDPPGTLDPACSDAIIEIAEKGGYPTVAVRSRGWKYIHFESKPDELFDLRADPGEEVDLGPDFPGGEAQRLRQLALEVVARRQGSSTERIELEEQVVRQLEALGYL